MGVPAFFRWLSRKYPSIVVKCDDGVKGQYHFDNLYLDMNGIIHPCSHPENKPAPANEEEMFLAIFEYIEDILKIVKPKKLLYMAIDGVAPRAKMNQQRSRRFRAAQESYEKLIEINKVKENLRKNDIEVPEKEEKAHFDSNVITPGTDFMMNLSDALRTWINRKLSDDYDDVHGIWPKDLLIILSDATVPGEGEHKIMDYIRRQKADKKFDPNLSHCLYGADADLIMLGLATHEPNFTILREEFKPNQAKCCDLCGQLGHELKDCTGESKPVEDLPVAADTEFIYIRLNVLREYLEKECHKDTNVRLDFERFIDDYVFLCFFVGNDFLPHLPSLEIRENAIDRLIKIYKYVMEAFPDAQDSYLTKNGFVNKQRVQLILQELGEYEDEIFKQRQQSDLNFKERNKRRKLFQAEKDLKWTKPEAILKDEKPEVFHNAKEEAAKVRMAYHNNNDNNTNDPNSRLNQMLVNPNDSQQPQQQQNPNKRKRESDDSDSEPEDPVQLYNEGWKERYYLHKFGAKSFEKISKQVADEYFKGLCWVMLYYYQGCPDWKWFFPYHYACFASDFKNIEKIDVKFDSEAKPFRPLEQLMSVFPAASSQNLPPTWRDLMTNNDSPIIDFYPTTFKIDLNGKKAAWMGVALLPFIDEDRLFSALQNVYANLSENEIFRNRLGSALMFTSKTHPVLSEKINDVIEIKNDDTKDIEHTLVQESEHNLISGTIKKSILFSQAYGQTLCCEYNDPQYKKGFVYRPILLKNARIPPAVLKPQDLDKFQRYRPNIGMNPRNDRAYVEAPGHRMIERSVQKEYDRQQPYHNQYGYQNFQHQYGQQYSGERYNYHNQNRNYNNNYHNDYHNNNRNNNTNQRNFQHSQQQQKYSNYNTDYSSNNSSNLESNYSKSSYYQDAQRGPNYQQHYSSSSNNNNYNRYPSHYQQQQSSSQSNISSYYTSDYVTSNNNQQPQQQQPHYDNSSWYRSKSNNNYHHHHQR